MKWHPIVTVQLLPGFGGVTGPVLISKRLRALYLIIDIIFGRNVQLYQNLASGKTTSTEPNEPVRGGSVHRHGSQGDEEYAAKMGRFEDGKKAAMDGQATVGLW
ncbi:hypothetical protein Tco_0880259 [Tanacetum coccineum]